MPYLSEVFRRFSVLGDAPSDGGRDLSGEGLGRIGRKADGAGSPGKLDGLVESEDDKVALDRGDVMPRGIRDDLGHVTQEALGLRRDIQVVVCYAHLGKRF